MSSPADPSENNSQVEDPRYLPLDDNSPSPKFHMWRLLGFITVLMFVLAGVSAGIDIALLGWDR